MSAVVGFRGGQAGFFWRPGDRSMARIRVIVEGIDDPPVERHRVASHVRNPLGECGRRDVRMDAEVTIGLAAAEAEPKYALRVTVPLSTTEYS